MTHPRLTQLAACALLVLAPTLAAADPQASPADQAAVAGTPPPPPGADPASPADAAPLALADANALADTAGKNVREAAAALPELDKLRTPDSPAFVILGVSPTEIQRPATPRGLAIALSGFASDTGLAIPKNFALEVSPYWLVPHPDLDLATYRSDGWLRPIRTFSLSIGTTESQREEQTAAGAETHTDADIGIGFRTMLAQVGGGPDACTAKATELVEKLRALRLDPDAADRAEAATHGTPGTAAYDAALTAAVKQKIARQREETMKPLRTADCVALASSPGGFAWDLAGAIDLHATDSQLTRAATSVAKYALWTSASYDTTHFSAIGVARLTSQRRPLPSETFLDAGLRGIYKRDDFGLSAEALVRGRWMDGASDATYKLALAVEYQLSADTWVTVTFGRGFAFTPSEAGSWFSLTNLQWGIGKPIVHADTK